MLLNGSGRPVIENVSFSTASSLGAIIRGTGARLLYTHFSLYPNSLRERTANPLDRKFRTLRRCLRSAILLIIANLANKNAEPKRLGIYSFVPFSVS